MSDAAVEKIQLAEKEAEDLLAASRAKSKEILDQAREEADSLYKDLIDRARKMEKEKIRDMEKKAQEDSQDLLAKTDSQVQRLEDMKKEDFPDLVKSIVEKVVV